MQNKVGTLVFYHKEIDAILVNHFSEFLSKTPEEAKLSFEVILQGPCLNDEQRETVMRPFSNEDVS